MFDQPFDWDWIRYSNPTVTCFGYRGGRSTGLGIAVHRNLPEVQNLERWLVKRSGQFDADNHTIYKVEKDLSVLYFWFTDFSCIISTGVELEPHIAIKHGLDINGNSSQHIQ